MPTLIITVPAFNEGELTAVNTEKIYKFCEDNLNALVDWKIVLTENGSKDNTFEMAQQMAHKYPDKVLAYHFDNRGKATALKCAWAKLEEDGYTMDFISMVDMDIPFDLDYFLQALNEMLTSHYDLVVGNRYSRTSSTSRPLDQIVISKTYNFVCRLLFGIKIHDIQCGLKIFKYQAIKPYLSECDHPHAFFDLQIIKMLTDHKHPIKEISIDWDESNNRPTTFVKRKEVVAGLKALFTLLLKK